MLIIKVPYWEVICDYLHWVNEGIKCDIKCQSELFDPCEELFEYSSLLQET